MSDIIPNTDRPVAHAPGFRIGDWLVEPALGRVSRDRVTVHLRPQLMDLVLVFARQPGRVISKDELFAAVWSGQSIAESALARCVAELRQVFGDDARSPHVIETIPKRGYRLVAPVAEPSPLAPPDAPPPVDSRARDAQADAAAAHHDPSAGMPAAPAAISHTIDVPPALVSTTPHDDTRQPVAGSIVASDQPGAVGGWFAHRAVRFATVAAVSLLVGVITFAVTVWMARPVTPVDRIILTDFANRTQETGLDATLRLALAVHLQREPSFEVLSDGPPSDLPAPDGNADGASADGSAVTEVCVVQQGTAVIHGSITRFGNRYALGLEATSCRSGSVLARELVEARSKDEVLDALELAAANLRRKLVVTLAEDRRGRATRLALHAGTPDRTERAPGP